MEGRQPWHKRVAEVVIEVGEDIAYFLIAALLLVLAFVILVEAGHVLLGVTGSRGVQDVVLDVLDLLLLVFIVVELLFAVRTTIARRELVAEPFLLVGVISVVKEIIVLSVKAPDLMGTDKADDVVVTLGVLGALVLVLAAAAWMLRIKEREPSEGEDSPSPGGRDRVGA